MTVTLFEISSIMFVIGTAGHVDHGKSTLVQALTGINPIGCKKNSGGR